MRIFIIKHLCQFYYNTFVAKQICVLYNNCFKFIKYLNILNDISKIENFFKKLHKTDPL